MNVRPPLEGGRSMVRAHLSNEAISGLFWIALLLLAIGFALRLLWLRRGLIALDMEEGNRDYLQDSGCLTSDDEVSGMVAASDDEDCSRVWKLEDVVKIVATRDEHFSAIRVVPGAAAIN